MMVPRRVVSSNWYLKFIRPSNISTHGLARCGPSKMMLLGESKSARIVRGETT